MGVRGIELRVATNFQAPSTILFKLDIFNQCPSHAVEYDPFIKSQLASGNLLEGLMRCKFGHLTLRILRERTPRTPSTVR